jgi:hypothetical protein
MAIFPGLPGDTVIVTGPLDLNDGVMATWAGAERATNSRNIRAMDAILARFLPPG